MDFADRYIWIPLLTVLLVSLALLPTMSWLILGPISHPAGRLKAPTRFQLSDFIWLLVMLQAALGVCVQFVGLETGPMFVILLGFLVFAITALWVGAISFLSHAGVASPLRRAVFVLAVLPLTLAFLIGLPSMALAGAFEAIQYLHFLRVNHLDLPLTDLTFAAARTMSTLLAFAVAGQVLRWLSIWVATGKVHLRKMPDVAAAK